MRSTLQHRRHHLLAEDASRAGNVEPIVNSLNTAGIKVANAKHVADLKITLL